MFDSGVDIEQVFVHHRPMHRTYVRRRVVAAALFLGVLAVAVPAGASAVGGRPADAAPTRYVVRPGDTVWSIAQASWPDQDPRAVVDAIAEANALDDGAIVPGQSLIVPTG
jgi:nucleoid-associated protein YgaU